MAVTAGLLPAVAGFARADVYVSVVVPPVAVRVGPPPPPPPVVEYQPPPPAVQYEPEPPPPPVAYQQPVGVQPEPAVWRGTPPIVVPPQAPPYLEAFWVPGAWEQRGGRRSWCAGHWDRRPDRGRGWHREDDRSRWGDRRWDRRAERWEEHRRWEEQRRWEQARHQRH